MSTNENPPLCNFQLKWSGSGWFLFWAHADGRSGGWNCESLPKLCEGVGARLQDILKTNGG